MNLLALRSPPKLSNSAPILILEEWEREIDSANQAFKRDDFLYALAGYEAALVLAKSGINDLLSTSTLEVLFDGAEEQIAALVVTQHNLVNLFMAMGQIESAINHLCGVHESLFQLAYHSRSEIQKMARRHLNITYRELMTFAKLHGKQKRIEQSLLMTQYICDCCRKKIGVC